MCQLQGEKQEKLLQNAHFCCLLKVFNLEIHYVVRGVGP